MMQMVELHFRQKPKCDYATVKTLAQQILESDLDSNLEGNLAHPDPVEAEKVFLIYHKDHIMPNPDTPIPAQTGILANDQPIQFESYRQDIQQSWNCANAEELVRATREIRLVTELMTGFVSPQDRMFLFHGVLRAAIEVMQPHALVFRHSEQIIDPKAYMASCSDDPIYRPGSVNVRLFNVSTTNGEMVMDTLGLSSIGLHDLQCHFRALVPTDVARILLSTASYIFEKGSACLSGQTVPGIPLTSQWRCRFENSLTQPRREVLDLNPGEPYAAGKR